MNTDGRGSFSLLHGACVFSYCFLSLSHSSAKLHTGVLFHIIRFPVAGPEEGPHCVNFHFVLKWSRASRILCQGQRDSVTLGLWRTGKDIQHAQTMPSSFCTFVLAVAMVLYPPKRLCVELILKWFVSKPSLPHPLFQWLYSRRDDQENALQLVWWSNMET